MVEFRNKIKLMTNLHKQLIFYSSISLAGSGSIYRIRIRIQAAILIRIHPDPKHVLSTNSMYMQEQNFTFHLTPQQATDISNSSYRNELGRPEYRRQIQMRFSLLETSCDQAGALVLTVGHPKLFFFVLVSGSEMCASGLLKNQIPFCFCMQIYRRQVRYLF